jgi:hypothetical protein
VRNSSGQAHRSFVLPNAVLVLPASINFSTRLIPCRNNDSHHIDVNARHLGVVILSRVVLSKACTVQYRPTQQRTTRTTRHLHTMPCPCTGVKGRQSAKLTAPSRIIVCIDDPKSFLILGSCTVRCTLHSDSHFLQLLTSFWQRISILLKTDHA